MDFNLSMISVKREKDNYINNTLASFFATNPKYVLNLMVHNPIEDIDYISKEFTSNPLLNIVPTPRDEFERIQDWRVHRKFNHNFHRALSFPEIKPDQYKITMEDDIEFDPQFWDKLEEMLHMNNPIEKTVIALYACYDAGKQHRKMSKYEVNAYYGTQCVLYSPDVVPGAAKFIKEFGSDDYQDAGDMLLKAFIRLNGYNLFYSHRSLVQHVGYISTGLGNHHMTGTYKQEW